MLDGRKQEYEYSAVRGSRAWIQAPRRTLEYQLIVQSPIGARYRVDAGHEIGVGIDLALGTTLGDVLAYTRLGDPGDANIRIWDLEGERSIPTPEGVNSRDPEYGVAISGDHLLFGRDPRNNGTATQIVLLDISSGRSRVLARSHHGWVTADSLSGDWASYTVCGPDRCGVYRYRISSRRARRIHFPGYPYLYASSVTPGGTVFLTRGVAGSGCGGGVSIVRWTPHARRSVKDFAPRFDVGDMDVLVREDAMILFVARVTCSRRLEWDIYRYSV